MEIKMKEMYLDSKKTLALDAALVVAWAVKHRASATFHEVDGPDSLGEYDPHNYKLFARVAVDGEWSRVWIVGKKARKTEGFSRSTMYRRKKEKGVSFIG